MGIFSFNLPYTPEMIEQAENIMNMSKEKASKNPETEKEFKRILDELLNEKLEGKEQPPKGKNGGEVIKLKRGGMVSKNASKTGFKSRVAGRAAHRGYGKAFKK